MSYSVNEENLLLAAEKWCSERLSKASISEVEDAITQMTRKLSEHMVNAYAENLDPRAPMKV